MNMVRPSQLPRIICNEMDVKTGYWNSCRDLELNNCKGSTGDALGRSPASEANTEPIDGDNVQVFHPAQVINLGIASHRFEGFPFGA